MRLEELLNVIDENKDVYIHLNSLDNDFVAVYDGRNSIDPKWSDNEVLRITVDGCDFDIVVKENWMEKLKA